MGNLKGGRAETFGRLASWLYRRWAEPSLEPMHRRIAGEFPLERGRLLDVGCGPGDLTRMIAAARPGLFVLGLDLSPDMIRLARSRPPLPNLEFREGSPASAALSREFDFALSVLSFHHWEEPLDELSAIDRALKADGVFWLYEPDPGASDEAIRADHAPLWGWLRMPAWIQRRLSRGHGFTYSELERQVRPAIERSPFRVRELSRQGATWRIELRR